MLLTVVTTSQSYIANMNLLRALGLALLKVFVLGGLIGHYLPQVSASVAPNASFKHPYRDSIGVVTALWVLYITIIYPRYVDPLRDLPVAPVGWTLGKQI